MQLIDGEKITYVSSNNKLIVTTLRVKYTNASLFRRIHKIIPISEITGLENRSKSNPWLFLLAALFLISSLGFSYDKSKWGGDFNIFKNEFTVVLFVLCLCCLLLYFFTIKKVIILTSPSACIYFKCRNASNEIEILNNEIFQNKHKTN